MTIPFFATALLPQCAGCRNLIRETGSHVVVIPIKDLPEYLKNLLPSLSVHTCVSCRASRGRPLVVTYKGPGLFEIVYEYDRNNPVLFGAARAD